MSLTPLRPASRALATLGVLATAGLLAGCNTVVLNASGDVAQQQGRLIVVSVALMLLIVVPVIVLTLLFAWRYRAQANATYKPDWDHSTGLELIIWAAPLLIIIALGAITWISTHTLDPYRSLRRLGPDRPIYSGTGALVIDVVALDWKWLFIYPGQGIATVNEVAAPVDVPIEFRITSSTVMNAFYVPALAGMIYAMPGMETKLNAVINQAGVYDGLSSHYSGAGFSQMRFKFRGLSDADFQRWVDESKKSGGALTRVAFQELEKPSVGDPVKRWASVDADLYNRILFRCTDTARMCTDQMAAIDARQLGSAAAYPVAGQVGAERRYVVALACTPDDPEGKGVAAALQISR